MPLPLLSPVALRRRHALSALLHAGALAALAPRAAQASGRAAGTPAPPADLTLAAVPAAPALPDTPAEPLDMAPQQLAGGVYLVAGANAEPSAANAGRVGNLGFVVGRDRVALIDTGSSRARADELLAAVRSVTRLPVMLAVLTHPAQEFLFGASRFAELGIPVVAHPAAGRLIEQRCQHCLDTLRQDLGEDRMAGTRLALPQALPAAPIDLGGRRLDIRPSPVDALPANLTVLDPASGVLFAGALLSVRRIPGTQDSRPEAWRQALARLDDERLATVVPAWGPVASRQPAAGQCPLAVARHALDGYLRDLDAQARNLLARGVPLGELAGHAELPAYRDWNGYPATHLHNIFYRYLQLEAEDLESH